MYNNIQCCDDVRQCTIPALQAGEVTEKVIANLEDVINSIHLDNSDGFEKCKTFLTLKLIAAGEYQPVIISIDLRAHLQERWGKTSNLVRFHLYMTL
jgi:hypothetical protein